MAHFYSCGESSHFESLACTLRKKLHLLCTCYDDWVGSRHNFVPFEYFTGHFYHFVS